MRFQRALIGGGELRALLRPLLCFIAVVSCGKGVGLLPAWAAPASTITTLSVISGGSAVTTVAQGSVVTLTATVTTGGTPVTPGLVNFCDATAKFCTDIHLLGTAQLTADGTATLKFRPGVGNHSYKAVLAEPAGLGPSSSTASSLTVTASQGTGQLATTTYLEASGVPNIFSLTATVPGNGNTLPTGMVSFVEASDGNAVLGTAALTSETGGGFAGSSLLPVTSQNSSNTVSTADFNGDGIPDLVILGSGISVLLGNGDGTFTAAPSPLAFLPGAIAVGDFNGDGIPDLAVAPALDEGTTEVLLGNGDGTFTSAGGILENDNNTVTSKAIASADFNGDGKLDLVETCASANEGPCNLLLILSGNGDGSFTQSCETPLAFAGSQSMAVGDFNGDGQPDVAVINSGANGVNVFLNGGGCVSAVPAIPATGLGPSSIAAADFNGVATPGASGTSTITIVPSGGFTGSVALSCAVTGPATAVDPPTCSVAAPPAITGITGVSATLTVNTTAASSSSNVTGQAATAFHKQHNRMSALGGGSALAAFLFFGLPLRRRRTKTLLSLLLLGAFAAIVMGCGGAQKAATPVTTPADPGTTVGSYMVTVTGSSGTLTASTTVAATVN